MPNQDEPKFNILFQRWPSTSPHSRILFPCLVFCSNPAKPGRRARNELTLGQIGSSGEELVMEYIPRGVLCRQYYPGGKHTSKMDCVAELMFMLAAVQGPLVLPAFLTSRKMP